MCCGILFLLLYVYDDDSFVICLNMQIEMWNFGMWILVQNYVVNNNRCKASCKINTHFLIEH
jgi:hypothetical protein